MRCCVSFALSLTLVTLATFSCSGQGLHRLMRSRVSATQVTSTNTFRQQYLASQRTRQQKPSILLKSSCRNGRPGTVCAGSSDSNTSQDDAELMLAASPDVYSSLDTTYSGGIRLVSPPGDQGDCHTCAAFAVASAAETAMASVLGVDVANCSVSVQALHFCPPKESWEPRRECKGGWLLKETTARLSKSWPLPTTDCLEYKPPNIQSSQDDICTSNCETPSPYAKQGRFDYIEITTWVRAQQHIRQYGGVVSAFDVMTGFKSFFKNPANRKAVFRPSPGAGIEENHAIVLVGYNNKEEYWLAKNSWGTDKGDGGYFKVAYNTCSILTGDKWEAYGLIWKPDDPQLIGPVEKFSQGLSPGPTADCYQYKVHPGDYLSRISWLANVPLEQLLRDNAGVLADFNTPPKGTKLLICNPDLSSQLGVGAEKDYQRFEGQYSRSRSWRVSYKLNPKSACTSSSSSSLCAAAAAAGSDALAQLMLAASPQVYSSLDARYTSGVRLVAPSLDQQSCDTCSAMAIASAAETAMASVYRVNVADCRISVQALHFCPPDNKPARRCKGGWSLTSTLSLLQQYSQQLPTEACMPYKPDQQGVMDRSERCGRCSEPNKYASQGSFDSYHITTMWDAQLHIRRYGSVVTRFDIYNDFKPFFSNRTNAEAIYKPKRGAKHEQNHAVVLVGYNNDQQYWIAKNSWGSDFALNGFFKVAFGVCSIFTATGEAYGISWEPKETPNAAKIQLLPGPKPNCYWYKALRGDYMSRVAWLANIPLDRFMLDNVEYVKDLDASLEGVRLLVCGPKPGTFVAPQTSAPPAPSSSGTSENDPLATSLAFRRTAGLIQTPFAATAQAPRCLSTHQGAMTDGARAVSSNCNGGPTQRWVRLSNYQLRLENTRLSMCLAVSEGGTGNGTPVAINNCDPGMNQKWFYDHKGRLRPFNSPTKCLDVFLENRTDGAELAISDCHDELNQVWKTAPSAPSSSGTSDNDLLATSLAFRQTAGLIQTPFAATAQAPRCLSTENGSLTAGARAVSSNCNGGPTQRWVRLDNHQLQLENTNMCLDVYWDETDSGTPVVIHYCHTTGHPGMNQKWFYDHKGRLRPFSSPTRCLDVYHADTTNGAGVAISECHDGLNQVWRQVD